MTQPPVPPNPYQSGQPPVPRRSGNTGLIVGVSVGAAVLLLVAVVIVVALTLRGGQVSDLDAKQQPSATASEDDRVRVSDGEPATPVDIEAVEMSEPDSAKGGTKCRYSDADSTVDNPDLKEVGSPEDGDKPDSGTQDMAIATGLGELVVKVDNEKAPCTAASFDYLAGKDFFDGSNCHRLTTEDLFVLQCGDPAKNGRGGPTYRFDDEYTPKDTAKEMSKEDQERGETPKPNYLTGAVAMANSGPGTNGSQFFIVYKDTYLPPNYTVFGELTVGMDIVNEIADNGAVAPK